ncbi:two-component system sensor histidine kinase MtrB [Streptomyces sp. 2333.5]|uniref:sensor histidine kinase n=1 Tax=unclassified Streptomyces TaxID=2593676 RepID=UPI0008949F78|nr:MULTISPECIES: HAMP domain-containing sensor histidine kinase [unclassified Streptomyces]PJJ04022.1 two-component system sensor histidine kinase MtrB [Streptomyces sp. 2333.5]SEE39784.1 two-component system, OmpR family, sensor histidine kinase MtrB [Streptomyces sp. 2314.4]SEE65762.1 two-component system, OmpR family, sensor histidine kinase MtrB [Streptomyces sp. 2112.2]
MRERSASGATEEDTAGGGAPASGRRALRLLRRASGLLRWTSLRLRLVVVFALVALTAAVSASGIAYWLNRNTVLDRTQNAVLNDFRKALEDSTRSLPLRPRCAELQDAARQMAAGPQNYAVLLIGVDSKGKDCAATTDKDLLTLTTVPASLRTAVNEARPVDESNRYAHHLYWQRREVQDTPYLVAGAKVTGGGPTGYMIKSLATEQQDLNSLAWSLGIATALALVGSALLAQAAATTVLRPVQRLGHAARQLGEGRLDTRLRVTGTDELADLSRTFNRTAERLEQRVEELSGREAASRRFVADMSHELRTPLTAITAVSEVLEEEAESLDPMIAPAVQLVVSETRRLNDLVENLMEVTRFDAGTARLVLDDVDVADQVTACIDARAWLDAVDLDADRGIVARLDPRRLDVILANLIGNALKHGGSPVRVSVRTEAAAGTGAAGRTGSTALGAADAAGPSAGPEEDGGPQAGAGDGGPERSGHGAEAGRPGGGTLVIRVRDHGPGIPEEVLPHVFDRFYKASASRPRSEGSGLGLSIALENAHIHGGEITAANLPEGGAVFTLRLPMDASPLADGDRERGRDDDAADEGTEGDR